MKFKCFEVRGFRGDVSMFIRAHNTKMNINLLFSLVTFSNGTIFLPVREKWLLWFCILYKVVTFWIGQIGHLSSVYSFLFFFLLCNSPFKWVYNIIFCLTIFSLVLSTKKNYNRSRHTQRVLYLSLICMKNASTHEKKTTKYCDATRAEKKVANANAMNTKHDLNMIYFVHFNFA